MMPWWGWALTGLLIGAGSVCVGLIVYMQAASRRWPNRGR